MRAINLQVDAHADAAAKQEMVKHRQDIMAGALQAKGHWPALDGLMG